MSLDRWFIAIIVDIFCIQRCYSIKKREEYFLAYKERVENWVMLSKVCNQQTKRQLPLILLLFAHPCSTLGVVRRLNVIPVTRIKRHRYSKYL